jgi:hypothetical protein
LKLNKNIRLDRGQKKAVSQAAFRHYISLLRDQIGCYSYFMNKRSVKKKKPAKPTRARTTRRKTSARHATARNASARQVAKKSKPIVAPLTAASAQLPVTVAQITAASPVLRSHKFSVGQTVLFTSSPITRPGANGTYKVVRLLPSDGDDYQYRIKNSGEAFERVAKESQLEHAH